MTTKPSKELLDKKESKLRPTGAYFAEYQKSLGDGTRKYRGLETGMEPIDKLTNGLSGLVLLAAKSGVGKTQLAVQLALGIVKTRLEENRKRESEGLPSLPDIPVLFYSLEMSRNDIMTQMMQVSAMFAGHTNSLTRNDIDLHGADENLDEYKKNALSAGMNYYKQNFADLVYIRDGSRGIPGIIPTTDNKSYDKNTIFHDVMELKETHDAEDVFVVIDSVQDIVNTSMPNQVQSEVKCCNDLNTLYCNTGATILAIAQKNKSSVNSTDFYGDVMGSMSFIHKSNTVLMLNTAKEVAAKKNDGKQSNVDAINEYTKQTGKKPLCLHQEKGRYTGSKDTPLILHGWYGYFTCEVDPNAKNIIK